MGIDFKYEWAKFKENFWLRIANKMPKRLQLWCFVLVYGADGNGPGDDYNKKYDFFKAKHQIKDM